MLNSSPQTSLTGTFKKAKTLKGFLKGPSASVHYWLRLSVLPTIDVNHQFINHLRGKAAGSAKAAQNLQSDPKSGASSNSATFAFMALL